MKVLKYGLLGLAGLLVLAVVAAAIFAATFDPNRYKEQIEVAVKAQTGRTLKLQGDLEVAFFPSLGARVAKATLSEKDPSRQFLSVEQAHGSVAFLPLLRGEVIVDRIRVSGLNAQVIKDKDGRFNFQDLIERGEDGKAPPAASEPKGEPADESAVKFDIAGFALEDAAVSYKDLATGQSLAVTDVHLSTGRIAERANGRLQLSAALKGAQPALDVALKLAGGYDIDLPGGAYALSALEGTVEGTLEKDAVSAKLSAPKVILSPDKATGEAIAAQFSLKGAERNLEASLQLPGIQGSAKALSIPKLTASVALSGAGMPRPMKVPLEGSVEANLEAQTLDADLTSKFDESTIRAKLGLARFSPPAYRFDVNVDRLNLDQYFPPQQAPASGAPQPAGKPPAQAPETPVDLSALEGLDARGSLQVGSLQAQGLKLSDVKAEVKAANGRLDVSPHSARLYEGALNGAISLHAKGNRVAVKETLSSISIGPLLRDFAQQDRLEGKGNVSLDVAGAGASVEAIKRSLDGTAKLDLRDGAVRGINVAEVLRKVKSLGRSEEGTASADQKTDFTELHASFKIKDGVAHNDDLEAKSPLLRVNGAGKVDIAASTLDYVVKATVVATAKGQGGAGLDDLAGITVPVHLTGPFAAMSYKVDYGAVAADIARTKAGAKIKEQVEKKRDKIEDKVKDRLKGLLR